MVTVPASGIHRGQHGAVQPARIRREPPSFRLASVERVVPVTLRLQRVTLCGEQLDGFAIEQPAASVRLLLPEADADDLVLPAWNGNEFLLPDGRRPTIRTFTPRRFDTAARRLDVEVVRHGHGAASEWAAAARPGDAAAVSGPGRGYDVDRSAPAFLLAGDETAIPAMQQLLEVLPPAVPVRVLVEIGASDARFALTDHPHADVTWHELDPEAPPGAALFDALLGTEIVDGARVWVAGEAAAVQRIRRHLFDERGLARAEATVRGYWKHGRAGEAG
jgi:NADPH-dependent ferric siderophore reductase